MARITEISAHPQAGSSESTGLHRQFFRLALPSAITVLAGPQGGGKTTRLEAVELATAGPATTNTDPARVWLGTGDDFPVDTAVTVRLDTGDSWTRPLVVDGPGSRALNDAADADAARLVGRALVRWDLGDLTKAPPRTRAQLFQTVARAGNAIEAWDVPRAIEEVRRFLATPGADADAPPPDYTLVDRLAGKLDKVVSGEQFLTSGRTQAETWAKDARSDGAVKAGAAKTTEAEASKAPTCPVAETDDRAREQELHQERARLADIDEARAQADERRTQHEAHLARLRDGLAGLVEQGKRLGTPIPPPVHDAAVLADLEARVAAAQAEVSAPIPAHDGADLVALKAAVESTKASLKTAQEAEATAHAEVTRREGVAETARGGVGTADRGASTARGALDSIDGRIAALSAIVEGDDACVQCGTRLSLSIERSVADLQARRQEFADGWSAAGSAAAKAIGDLRSAEASIRVAARAYQAATQTTGDASRASYLAQQRLTDATQASAGHVDQVKAQRARTLTDAQAAVTREQASRTRAATDHETRETQRKADHKAAQDRYKVARAAVKAAEATALPEVPDAPDPARLAAIDTELSEIRARDATRASRVATIERARRAGVALATAIEATQRAEALVYAIRIAQARMASAAYDPIQTAARRLVAGIDGLPVPFFHGVDHMGAVIPGKGRVPFHSLSQGQSAIVAACLAYAMQVVARNPARVVLLDEFTRADKVHQPAFLRALVAAAERGDVDNVILTISAIEPADVDHLRGLGADVQWVPFERIPGADDIEDEKPAPGIEPAPTPAQEMAPESPADEEPLPF